MDCLHQKTVCEQQVASRRGLRTGALPQTVSSRYSARPRKSPPLPPLPVAAHRPEVDLSAGSGGECRALARLSVSLECL